MADHTIGDLGAAQDEALNAKEEAEGQAAPELAMEDFVDPDGQVPERIRGPVVLRGDQRLQSSTTDERLLDTRGPTDWVHTDPWRVLRIQAEFVEGFGSLSLMPQALSAPLPRPSRRNGPPGWRRRHRR